MGYAYRTKSFKRSKSKRIALVILETTKGRTAIRTQNSSIFLSIPACLYVDQASPSLFAQFFHLPHPQSSFCSSPHRWVNLPSNPSMRSPAPRSPSLRSPTLRGKQRTHDRQSGSVGRGLPKKNGAGGKTVWGAANDQTPVACLDKKDPNYDSEEDAGVLPPLELNVRSNAASAAVPAPAPARKPQPQRKPDHDASNAAPALGSSV